MPNGTRPPIWASRVLSSLRDPDGPQILGDLSEEYVERARSLGAAAARRWYWRETLRNAWVLLQRKRIVGTTLRAMLAVVSVNSIYMVIANTYWRFWARLARWPSPYRRLVYRDPLWMAWPMGFGFEIIAGPIVAFALGYLFALAVADRAKQMRIAAVVLWLVNCTWFFVLWAFVWTQPPGHFTASHTLHMPGWLDLSIKEQALVEYVARQVTAAGAFFVGAGIAMARRKTVETPSA